MGPTNSRPARSCLSLSLPSGFARRWGSTSTTSGSTVPPSWCRWNRSLKTNPGADEPERLKRFLYDCLADSDASAICSSSGDVDVMPVRYMVLDRGTPAAFNYAFYPSDLYYADLAKQNGAFEDWNAMKQGFHARYFGEVRGETNKTRPDQLRPGRLPPGNRLRPLAGEHRGRGAASSPRKPSLTRRASATARIPGMRRADFFNVEGYVDVRDRMTGWAAKMPPRMDSRPLFLPGRQKAVPHAAPGRGTCRRRAQPGSGPGSSRGTRQRQFMVQVVFDAEPE